MQTLNDIKALLARHGLRPRHRLGQNFLHDLGYMQRIVEAATIAPDDVVLEVGAGTGSLSEALLEAGARLVAVEYDRNLEPILRERYAPYGDRVRLVMGDVLAGKHAINPEVIAAVDEAAGADRYTLVANLPYNIASPLLVNLALDHPRMQRGVVMIQREVADRLTAGPGSKTYGPLSVVVQAMCGVRRLMALPPGCFWPPPKVHSAVVELVRRSQPLTDDPHQLARFAQRLFQKRRKQLRAILGDVNLPAGVEPKARPESLTVEQLIELARRVDQA
ncbi:MAG: 16S rRNA (adenine(1518)-N(6)/adenine(1519)-N(6))-dimethyltransferase RsmA [Phycisphaeraceae bacterium]